MKRLFKNEDFLVIFLFVAVASILVGIWYKGVGFYGGGEEGLSLWRPEKSFSLAKSVWLDIGLGYPSPFFLPRITLYAWSFFLGTVFSPRSIQMLFFATNIFMALLGTHLLTKKFVKDNTSVSLVAGLFYVFNLYTQSQVFARFVYSGIFAWAFIPILLYFFAYWLESAKSRFLFLFLAISLAGSHMYSHPSYVLILWGIMGLWFLFSLKTTDHKKELLKRFILVFALWIITNIWWIYPMVKLSGGAGGNPSIRGWEYDFATLQGLSRDFENSDIFLLRQKYFFDRSGNWGDFYKNPFTLFASWATFIFVIVGILRRRFVTHKAFLVVLFLVGWFLAKGANPPLGSFFYENLFRQVPIFGMFRNSYEKLGLIFLLPYAIFFAIGTQTFVDKLMAKAKVIFCAFVVFGIFGYLVWPLWLGNTFSPLARVSVPDYYASSNSFLNSAAGHRGLSIPFTPGEGVHYKWSGGDYYGLEPSEFLFDEPVVSWVIPYTHAVDVNKRLVESLANKQLPSDLLEDMGIGYIILHSDMDTVYSSALAQEESKELLDSHNKLQRLGRFGELDVYSVKEVDSDLIAIEAYCEDPPSITYEKVNSGRYFVHINGASCPYNMILKVTFHDFWQAKMNGEVLADNYVARGYANGWKIDKRGDYGIDIIFKIWPWE